MATLTTYNAALLGVYSVSLVPLSIFMFLAWRSGKGGLMTAFGLQTGVFLIMRIVYLALPPRSYTTIFAMSRGNALLMFMDLIPEILKLTSWVTVLSYWKGLLSTEDLGRRQATEACRGPLWMGCMVVSTVIWVFAFILIGVVYGNNIRYKDVRVMEGAYLFTVAALLGLVGAFLIIRFLIYFKEVMNATATTRRDEASKGSVFMRLLRMRVTYATSLATLAMVIYFSVLLAVATTPLPREDFLTFWRVLTVLDDVVTLAVLFLLAPRNPNGDTCQCIKRRMNKYQIQHRGSSSLTPKVTEQSVQSPVSENPSVNDAESQL